MISRLTLFHRSVSNTDAACRETPGPAHPSSTVRYCRCQPVSARPDTSPHPPPIKPLLCAQLLWQSPTSNTSNRAMCLCYLQFTATTCGPRGISSKEKAQRVHGVTWPMFFSSEFHCMQSYVSVCVCLWVCWGQGYQSGILLSSATPKQKLGISLYYPIIHLIVVL